MKVAYTARTLIPTPVGRASYTRSDDNRLIIDIVYKSFYRDVLRRFRSRSEGNPIVVGTSFQRGSSTYAYHYYSMCTA